MQTKISKVNTRKEADDGFIKWPSTHLSQRNGFFSFYSLLYIHVFLSLFGYKNTDKMTKNVAAVAVVLLVASFALAVLSTEIFQRFVRTSHPLWVCRMFSFEHHLATPHTSSISKNLIRQRDRQLQTIRGRSCRHRLLWYVSKCSENLLLLARHFNLAVAINNLHKMQRNGQVT